MVNNSAQSTLGELRDPDAEVDGLARSLSSGRGLRRVGGLIRPPRILGDLLNGINPMLAVQSCLQKYFCSRLTQIKSISLAVSSHSRGVSRSSRTRGGMRWTRQRWACDVIAGRVLWARERSQGALTTDACRGRRSRVVLTPRRRRQVRGGEVGPTGCRQAFNLIRKRR